MTALEKYDVLEATGLWRETKTAQRREVIVSLGDATLILSDLKEQPLTHWSLAAVARANPGQTPALYHPDGDPDEILELSGEETQMIDAIEKLRRAIQRSRPKPGRLRWLSGTSIVFGIALLAVIWLPDALVRHSVSVVPDVNRAAIGQALLARIERVAGPTCADAGAQRALEVFSARLGGPNIVVVGAGVRDALHLPGNLIVLNRAVIEDYEAPDVAAGYVIAERMRAARQDPLEALLRQSGLGASLRLLTTGALSEEVLDAYAEHLVTAPRPTLEEAELLAGFAEAEVRSTPYAYARDISGETVLGLIEADPMQGQMPRPVLDDGTWLRLQNICGG